MEIFNEQLTKFCEEESDGRKVDFIEIARYIVNQAKPEFPIDKLSSLDPSKSYKTFRKKFSGILFQEISEIMKKTQSRRIKRNYIWFQTVSTNDDLYSIVFYIVSNIRGKDLRYTFDILFLFDALPQNSRMNSISEMILKDDDKNLIPLFVFDRNGIDDECMALIEDINLNKTIWSKDTKLLFCDHFHKELSNKENRNKFNKRKRKNKLYLLYDKEALDLILSSNTISDFLNKIDETLNKQRLYYYFDQYDSTYNFNTYIKIIVQLSNNNYKFIIRIFEILSSIKPTKESFFTIRAFICELFSNRQHKNRIERGIGNWVETDKRGRLVDFYGSLFEDNQREYRKPPKESQYFMKIRKYLNYRKKLIKQLLEEKNSLVNRPGGPKKLSDNPEGNGNFGTQKPNTGTKSGNRNNNNPNNTENDNKSNEEKDIGWVWSQVLLPLFNCLDNYQLNNWDGGPLVRLLDAIRLLKKGEPDSKPEVSTEAKTKKFEKLEQQLLRLLFFDKVRVKNQEGVKERVVNRLVGQLPPSKREDKLPIIALIAICKAKGYNSEKYMFTCEKVDIILSTEEEEENFITEYQNLFEKNDITIVSLKERRLDGISGNIEVAAAENTENIDRFLPINEVDVIVGTLASVVGVQKDRYKQVDGQDDLGRKQVVLVQDIDELMFNHKSLMLEVSNPRLNVLTPLLYPILFKIFSDTEAGISQFISHKERKNERELITSLQNSFKHNEIVCSIAERVKRFQEEMNNPKPDVSYDVDNMGKIVEDVFDWDKAVCFSKVPKSISRACLRNTIRETIGDKFTKNYSIYFGEANEQTRDVWLNFESQDDAMKVWGKRASFGKNTVNEIKRANSKGNKVVASGHVPRCRLAYDLEKAIEIAEILDLTRGINKHEFDIPDVNAKEIDSVIYAFKLSKEDKKVYREANTYVTQKKQLDLVLYYLRYVHLYCYYSKKQYKNIAEMMKHGFYPCLRENMFGICLSRYVLWQIEAHDSPFLELDDYDRDLNKSINRMKLNINDPVLEEDLCLKSEYSNLISELPKFLMNHCIVQFDSWVENCYKALYQMNESNEFYRNLICSKAGFNSNIQGSYLPDAFTQFLSMKNSSFIIPPMVSTITVSIPRFFNSYESFYGFTEFFSHIGTDFIKENLNVETVNLGPQENNILPFIEYPGLVFRSLDSWQQAVCLSVEQQLRLDKSVLVFAENLQVLSTQLKPLLNTMLKQLNIPFEVCKEEAEAVVIDNDETKVFLATTKSTLHYDANNIHKLLHTIITYVPETYYEKSFSERIAFDGSYQLIVFDEDSGNIDNIIRAKNEATIAYRDSLDVLVQLENDIMKTELYKTKKNEQDYLYWKSAMLKTSSKGLRNLNVDIKTVLNNAYDAFIDCEHGIFIAEKIMLCFSENIQYKIPDSFIEAVETNTLNLKYSGLALYYYGYYVYFIEQSEDFSDRAGNILHESIVVIKRDIISLFEKLLSYESIVKGGLKQQIVSILIQFNKLIDFIQRDIKMIKKNRKGIHKNHVIPVVKLNSVRWSGINGGITDEGASCIRHCNMFGYFGYIAVPWQTDKSLTEELKSKSIKRDEEKFIANDMLDSAVITSDPEKLNRTPNIRETIRSGEQIMDLAKMFKIVIVVHYPKKPTMRFIPEGVLLGSEELVFEGEENGNESWYLQDRAYAPPILDDAFAEYNSRKLTRALERLLGKGPTYKRPAIAKY